VQRLRYMAWGEDRYEEGAGLTDNRYTGQREEGYGLYFYQARWYDPALGRFVQADSIIPIQTQGVQAWDRYGYVNNSPLQYIDESGRDVGCTAVSEACFTQNGLTTEMQIQIKAAIARGMDVNYVNTNSIILKGGPGSVSFKVSAEESYTGFSGSGESTNQKVNNPMNFLDGGNTLGAYFRDTSSVRENMGNLPEISGKVFFELTDFGYRITNISVSNSSFETIEIYQVVARYYYFSSDESFGGVSLFPYQKGVSSPDNGTIPPYSTRTISVHTGEIYHFNSVGISISILSASGRYGFLNTKLSVNPPMQESK